MNVALSLVAHATLVWVWAAAGCASTSSNAGTSPTRQVFSSDNGRISIAVFEGPASLGLSQPPSSKWEEFLFGPPTLGRTALRTPQGLAAANSRLWVCDQAYPDVFHVDLGSGTFRRALLREQRPASPIAVAAGESGTLYIADATRRSIHVYASDGTLVDEIPPDSLDSFEPTAVLAHGTTLFVADRGNRCIARFDLTKRMWLAPLKPPADQGPLVTPTGLAVTNDGILLITDALLGAIHRVALNGDWLEPVGKRGRGPGEMVRPIGICITSSGLIVVADAAKQAILVLDHQGDYLAEVAAVTDQWEAWTLPMGVACLGSQPGIIQKDVAADAPPQEWVVVSDMLGERGLTFVSLTAEPAWAISRGDESP